MKAQLQKLPTAAALSTVVFVSVTLHAGSADIINTPAEQFDWETTEEGVGFAPLMGDRFNEAYMAMVKLPAGLISPPHVKSANMFGLVVSGTVTHYALDADPSTEIPLPEGSYYKIPAGVPHISKCVSDVDCITFLYQDGKFDFVVVE